MKRMDLAIIAFALLGLLLPDRAQVVDSNLGPLNEKDLRIRLADTCDQVNIFNKVEHFPVLVPSPEFCSFKFRQSLDYKENVGFFDQNEKVKLQAEILPTSGRIISFTNVAAFEAAYGTYALLSDSRPPAKWTEAHAIDVATRFAEIFVKPWGSRLGPPLAQFGWACMDEDEKTHTIKTGPGEWIIKWGRQTMSGDRFATDSVQVNVSEDYGPFSIYLFFLTDYEDEHITPIPRETALIEARKGLDKVLTWAKAQRVLANEQIDEKPDFGLMIASPHNLDAMKSVADMAFSGPSKGRLAWVAVYHVTSSSDPSFNEHVGVYIDAKDGSFLGGTL